MENRFTLYFFPTSYCSQKVLIALKEKNAVFKSRMVNLFDIEHTEAWYMRINSLGQVPVLKDGEKIVRDSEDIIDYLDKEIHGDIRLVPGTESEFGKQVAKFRKLLSEIKVELLTFGTIFHPDLLPKDLQVPRHLRTESSEFKDRATRTMKTLTSLAEQHPDLRDAYMAKTQDIAEKLEVMQDKKKIEDVLAAVDLVFDQLEEQLRQMKIEKCDDSWLCGPEFSAADITLSVLLGRIVFLGFEAKYFPHEKRPNVQAYWKRVQQRENCQEVITSAKQYMLLHFVKEKAKIVLPVVGGVATAGLAIGLAAFLIHKYK